MLEGYGAEGELPRRFRYRQADFGLEPLAVFVHQRDEGDRRLADVGGEKGEVVEGLFRFGVEDGVLFQCGDTRGVRIRRLFRGGHHKSSQSFVGRPRGGVFGGGIILRLRRGARRATRGAERTEDGRRSQTVEGRILCDGPGDEDEESATNWWRNSVDNRVGWVWGGAADTAS